MGAVGGGAQVHAEPSPAFRVVGETPGQAGRG